MSEDLETNAQNSDSTKSRETLHGWIPALASDEEVRSALEKAFDYRGDVTLTLRSGERIDGYVFDRRADGSTLDSCQARLIPRDGSPKIAIRYSDIVRLEFTGRDTAEGKSFEAWIRKYNERKSRGEQNISLEPEALD